MNDIVKECRPAAFFESLGRRLKNDGMTWDGIFMVFVVFLSQVFTYVYLLVMGISLNARDYSILYSLSSLLTTIMIAPQVFNFTVSWFTSKISGNEYTLSLVRFFGTVGLSLSAASCILIYLLSPFIAHYLGIENPLMVIFVSVAIIFLQSAIGGMFKGLQKFKYQGIIQVLQGFALLFLGFVFVFAGLGIYGGLIAFPLSFTVTTALSWYFIHRVYGGKEEFLAKPDLFLTPVIPCYLCWR